MTIGQTIKEKRTKCGLTQNELAEKLNVTFQTVSKWENDINEPDLGTIKTLASVFGCSVDELLSYEGETKTEAVPAPAKPVEPEKPVAICGVCGKQLFENDGKHPYMVHDGNGNQFTKYRCDACQAKKDEQKASQPTTPEKKSRIQKGKQNVFDRKMDRPDKKLIIWSIVAAVVVLGIALGYCIYNYDTVGIGWTIGAPLIAAYCAFADVYCIFSASWVSEVFMAVASWSIRFPGIIFSFDLDGLMFLIVMKILFFIIGVMISIAAFLLALALSTVFSIFTLIPLIIKNATEYDGF